MSVANNFGHLDVKKELSFSSMAFILSFRTALIKTINDKAAMMMPHHRGRKAGPGWEMVPKE